MIYRQLCNRSQVWQRSLWKCFSYAVVLALLVFSYSENSLGAQNLVTNGDFGTGDLSGWLIANLAPDQTSIAYDGTDGVPSGSAYWDRSPLGNVFNPDNKDHLYQFIDVEVGESYTFDAQWKGDLYGSARNWAEVRLAFLPTDTPLASGQDFPGSWQVYKKAGNDTGIPDPNDPIDPPPDGWDWESIHLSPRAATPASNIFVATEEYMIISFNMGGRLQNSILASGEVFLSVDNVTVTLIPEPASVGLLVLGCLMAVFSTARRLRR